MLINGNIHIIASFLLFYTSTGFILPKLRKIIMDDLNTNAIPSQKSKLKLSVFTHSDRPSKANINSLGIPGAVWSIDPSISAKMINDTFHFGVSSLVIFAHFLFWCHPIFPDFPAVPSVLFSHR